MIYLKLEIDIVNFKFERGKPLLAPPERRRNYFAI
jgi:hypothetical protein